jgi:acyl-CoA synthetase (AMP-forming)/AMP-acid ligase II
MISGARRPAMADGVVSRKSYMAVSVHNIFMDTAAGYAAHDFLHLPPAAHDGDATGARSITYVEARQRVAELQQAYVAAGFGRGHRVAVALDNRPEFFLHFLALNALGASIVPLNATMSAAEIGYLVAHADVAAIITHATHAAHIRAAAPAEVPVQTVLADNGHFDIPAPFGEPRATADEAALLYTSGTTGKPKGCMLTNTYFREIGVLYTTLGGYCTFRPGLERLVTPLPVTHMNALCCSFMAMLMTGGCLVQLDRFHPSTWWQSLLAARATCFHYLGVMPAMLLSAPASDADDVSAQVRFAFGAGADPRHHQPFEQRFGVPLIEAWAMTETGAGGWITANAEPRHVGTRCFGRAPAALDWRIVDEAQRDVATGSPGELWVRRKGSDPRQGFFAGYYKDPAATAAAWQGDWFHTGDVVRIDAAGSFYFVDRLKNVVRRSGENIAAVEVESALLEHAAVQACAVAPIADDVRGEEVCALLVLKNPAAASAPLAKEIQQHCLNTLAYYKAPGYVCFVAELPQTASQKLARGAIRALAASQIETGSAIDLRAGKKRPGAAR